MAEYYSAEFAKNTALKNKENIYNKKLKTVFQTFINPAVEKGLLNVSIPEMYIDEDKLVIKYLEDLGYKTIYDRVGMNQYAYKVSWG